MACQPAPWATLSRRAALAGGLAVAAGAHAQAPRTFRIALSGLPPGLGNPHSSLGFPQMYSWPAVFDCLTDVDASGRIVGMLADRWVNDDERTWRFFLKSGIAFSNGEPCDAAAVAATLNYLVSDTGRSQATYRDAQVIEQAEAVDALTVRVRTVSADPIIPGKMAGFRIVPPAYFARVGVAEFSRAPIGTGPFVAQRWDQNLVRLARNPRAWRPPKVDAMELRALPDTAARLQALLSGAVDVALNLNPDDKAVVEAAGGRTVVTSRAAVLALQYITERSSPLTKPQVRKALNLAVDRRRIAQVILAGTTEAASQPTVAEAFGFAPGYAPLPYDPAEAKRLLADAGYPNGFRFPVTVNRGNSPNDTAVFQQVAADLAAVGVEMVITTITLAQFNRLVYDGQWGDAFAFSMHYGSLPAMDATVGLRYHSCLWVKPWNCDEPIAALIRAADATFDTERRRAILQDIQRRLRDDPPGIILHETRYLDGLGPTVKTFDAPFGFIRYHALDLV
ncbi:MAG: ABC transporter substrate-binding protein [Rhodospirillaceae bacterium]|nr:ABC transporter substrate-binding protein [Rhodospirillaceae bacterium]